MPALAENITATTTSSLSQTKEIEEALVKWQGWPTKFNTWVPVDDLQKITTGFVEAGDCKNTYSINQLHKPY